MRYVEILEDSLDLPSQLKLAKEKLNRLRQNAPHFSYSDEMDDVTFERKSKLNKHLKRIHSNQVIALSHEVEELKAKILAAREKGTPLSLFVTLSSQQTGYQRRYLHKLGEMIDNADASLEFPAETAITRFVGHMHSRSPDGGAVGIMQELMLEDAFSDQPSKQGREIRQQLEDAFAPIKAALRTEFGDTIELYRAQEEYDPNKKRHVLSWTGSLFFANHHNAGAKGRQVLTKKFALDDIVWITNRANQAEFIMKNHS